MEKGVFVVMTKGATTSCGKDYLKGMVGKYVGESWNGSKNSRVRFPRHDEFDCSVIPTDSFREATEDEVKKAEKRFAFGVKTYKNVTLD